MVSFISRSGGSARQIAAILLGSLVATFLATASNAPQEVWTARWNLPEAGTTNRVLGMKADREGDLLIAGDLTEASGATRVGSVLIGDHGTARYTDSNVVQNLPMRFYRPGR